MSITARAPAIPAPNNLIEGRAPGYKRQVAYLNSDGEVEGSRKEVMLYNATGDDIDQGTVLMVVFDGDEETNPAVDTCAESAVPVWVVVAPKAILDAEWGWFAYEGYVNALVEGTDDVAKDDPLEIDLVVDAISFNKGTFSAATPAIACAAQAADETALTKIYLRGVSTTILDTTE